MKIEAGDSIKHIPSGEIWYVLGTNYKINRVCAAGYPSTIANLSDCKLISKGVGLTTDELNYRNKEFRTDWD